MKRKTNSILIFICTSLFMFSLIGSRPLIPIYSNHLGATNLQIGAIIALFSLLPLFMAIPLGKLIDRIGSKTPLVVSVLIASLSLVIPYFLSTLLGVYISQVLSGLSQLVFVLAMQSYIGGNRKYKIRDYYIAIFSIGVAIGSFIGPLVSGILTDRVGYSVTLGALGALIILALPFIPFIKGKETSIQKEEFSNKKSSDLFLISDLRKAFIVSAIVLLAKDIYLAFFPLLAMDKGLSATMIGLLISLNALAGILIRTLLPYLVKKYSTNIIISYSIMCAGIAFLTIPMLTNSFLLGFVSFLLGLSLGIGQPLSISITINSLPPDRVGEGLGLRLSINKLTQVVMPLLLGGISALGGIASIFYVSGFLIISASLNTKNKSKEDNNSVNL
ncbi:MFS transporter [Alkalihalophilus pseudofirmus]|uniref:MFS transporter n=1 Tax=Alkalihalophilus pseudofirmus TaxID=79885 RepID=A0AAJ2NNB7_ALKPS|nr:MFS transporter [Alkalihalophilus pseudofirmus]MDV2885514.1 MFS transporter [Alkalihalophilus pseudofirmus]